MAKVKKTFCWNCWRDWKLEFLDLSPWEQEQFLDKNPDVKAHYFERGRCPFCGARYSSELDEWFEDLLLENEDWSESSEYDVADWEDV